ncbi:MAG: sugar transferase [Pirellulales bacterium]|nr:sugar transferase [Pirellulales bacterium]
MSSTSKPGQQCENRCAQDRAPLVSAHRVSPSFMAPARYFDRAMLWQWPLALIMLVSFAPVMILIAFLIRITSPGPSIYRQRRLGRFGKPFTLYKFRSMYLDAEAGTGAVWAKPGDPRITLLGKITRNLHLDELPQLFNIVRGEMALVGPRPERPEFAAKIEQHVSGFHQRLCIRPGITGLAQVHQGPDTDMNSVRRKLVYDLEYAQSANMWLDWRIMICTLLRATEITRSWGVRLLKIPVPCTQHVGKIVSNVFPDASVDSSLHVTPAQISMTDSQANDVKANCGCAGLNSPTGSTHAAPVSNELPLGSAPANNAEPSANGSSQQDDAPPPHSIAPVR